MKHGKHVISTRAHQTREHDKHVKHTKHESPQARHLADSTESQSYKTFIKRCSEKIRNKFPGEHSYRRVISIKLQR